VDTDDTPAVLHSCQRQLRLERRVHGVWRSLLVHDAGHRIADAASTANGEVFAASSWAMFLLRGDEIHDVLPTEGAKPYAVRTCGDDAFAVFEVDFVLHFGRWTGTTWDLEEVPTTVLGVTNLALDEACHPFLSVDGELYSRRAGGWHREPSTGRISALLARRDVLYVALRNDDDTASILRAPIVPVPDDAGDARE